MCTGDNDIQIRGNLLLALIIRGIYKQISHTKTLQAKTMTNVISFSQKKKQKQELKQQSSSIFDVMDAKFRGDKLSYKDKDKIKRSLRDRLSSLGYKFFLQSIKIDKEYIKRYKPIIQIEQKIGFSFEVSKVTKLKNGWVFYPLKADPNEDYSELLSKIIQLLEGNKNGK